MGEYADMALDDGFSAWGGGEDEEEGEVSFSRFARRRTPQAKTCRRCGQDGLWWQDTPNGWRLHAFSDETDELEMHVCSQAKASPQ